MSDKIIDRQYIVRRLMAMVMGVVMCVVSSVATYGVSNMERITIEKMPSAELLERSNRYIKETHQPDSALLYLKVLGSRSHKSSLTTEEADVISRGLTVLGGLYINEYHDYARAVMAVLEAQSVATKYNCQLRLAESEVALATLNLASLNYEDAGSDRLKGLIAESMERYENAFRIASDAGDGNLMGFAAVNLGLLGFDTQNLNRVADTLNKAASDQRVAGWQRLLCRALLSWNKGNSSEALQLVKQSKDSLGTSGKEARYRLQNDKIRLQMLLMSGERVEARSLGNQIVEITLGEGDAETAYEVYRLLWKDAKKQGETQLAHTYELEMMRARLSTQHTDVLGAIAEGKMQYEIENLGESLIADTRRISSLRQTLWLVGGFMVVLLGLLVALFVKHRQLRRTHRMIVMRDKELLAEPSSPIPELKSGHTAEDDSVSESDMIEQTENDKTYQLFKRVEEVMNHDEAVFEEDFSAVALAAKLHERQANISNAIQTCTGGSFNSLLAEVRVKEACRRILDKENYGNYTVEAIAFSVGYKSRSHFTSVFKKITGMSPSDYIRQARLAL
ncbi:MAG: helix-turn-helix transcriptional regulator [Bacteroides sp.]|nr:helix-turn-helix transcriptional regulator [Bacteroides sp.]